MGDYFAKEDKQTPAKETKKEAELISDFQTLCEAFHTLQIKINETTSQGYEAILPIRAELCGGRKTPDDSGQIGILRRRIETSRMYRMDVGIMMWNALKNIEDLDKWSERYTQYLEEHIDALKLISRSAFMIINKLQEEKTKLREEVSALQERIVEVQHNIPPMSKPSADEDDDHFIMSSQPPPFVQNKSEPPSMESQEKKEPPPLNQEEIQALAKRRQELFDLISTPLEERFPAPTLIAEAVEHRKFLRQLNSRLRNFTDALKIGKRQLINDARTELFRIATTEERHAKATQLYQERIEYFLPKMANEKPKNDRYLSS